jgi:hypothetical protein
VRWAIACGQFDRATTTRLIAAARLHLLRAEEETVEEFGVPITFLWVIAERPVQARAGMKAAAVSVSLLNTVREGRKIALDQRIQDPFALGCIWDSLAQQECT